jgi:hypothetical protein
MTVADSSGVSHSERVYSRTEMLAYGQACYDKGRADQAQK